MPQKYIYYFILRTLCTYYVYYSNADAAKCKSVCAAAIPSVWIQMNRHGVFCSFIYVFLWCFLFIRFLHLLKIDCNDLCLKGYSPSFPQFGDDRIEWVSNLFSVEIKWRTSYFCMANSMRYEWNRVSERERDWEKIESNSNRNYIKNRNENKQFARNQRALPWIENERVKYENMSHPYAWLHYATKPIFSLLSLVSVEIKSFGFEWRNWYRTHMYNVYVYIDTSTAVAWHNKCWTHTHMPNSDLLMKPTSLKV